MDPGRKRHLITVKKRDHAARDAYGSPDKNAYITVFRMRCNVQIMSGTEQIKNGIQLGTEYASILANFDKRLEHNHYLDWKGKIYSVEAIRPDDWERNMLITAQRSI